MSVEPRTCTSGEIEAKARWVWRETLKLHKRCPETRIASSLSCVELLCVLFYGGFMRYNARSPLWEGRDRLIISKGHGSISYYPILADIGYIGLDQLPLIGRRECVLKAIPDSTIPGYETTNGSVGQGYGVALGVALALDRKHSDARTFLLSGDGELFEGACWESIMLAGHLRPQNLIAIVDANKMCMMGYCKDCIDLEPLAHKFEVFGWKAYEVDGHNVPALSDALQRVLADSARAPKVLVAHTRKGNGVKELETDPLCHIRTLKPELIDRLVGE